MADFRFDIIADPTKALRALKQVETSLVATESAANAFTGVIKAAGAVLAVAFSARLLKNVLDTADAFAAMENKLRVVTGSTQELVFVTTELANISERSRSSLEDTAALYSRLAINSKELGKSQEELLQFTETLNKAIVVSGASAQEASAGLVQFSQGLASGRLSGDELRSVLEQLPIVADVIAKQLGVTRGELRALGKEGKITPDIIFAAFKNARQEIEDKFAKTVPTLGQSFTVLSNSVSVFIGTLDQSLGVTRRISEFILGLSDSIKTLPEAMLAAGQALAPIVDSIIGLFAGLSNAVGTIFDALAEQPEEAWNLIKKGARDAIEFMLDAFLAFGQTLRQIFVRVFGEINQVIANTGAALGAISVGNLEAAKAFGENVEDSLRRIRTNITGFGDEFASTLKQLQNTDIVPQVELTKAGADLGANVAMEFARGFTENQPAQNLIDEGFARIAQKQKELIQSAAAAATTAPGGGEVGAASPISKEALDLLNQLQKPLNEYTTKMENLNVLLKAGKLSEEQFGQAADEALLKALNGSISAEAGFQRFFANLRIEARDTAAVVEQSLNLGLNTAVDALNLGLNALTGSVDDVSEAFKELGRNALNQLQQILIRALLVRAVASFFPGAGAAPAVGSFAGGFQAGGTVQPGQTALVGERGPEMVRFGQTASIFPNPASQPQQKPEVKVLVVNSVDVNASVAAAMQRGEYDEIVVNRIGANKQKTNAQLRG